MNEYCANCDSLRYFIAKDNNGIPMDDIRIPYCIMLIQIENKEYNDIVEIIKPENRLCEMYVPRRFDV